VSIEVRPLREEDAEPITVVHLATWRAAYGALLPPGAFDRVDLAERAARWRGIARGEHPDRGTFVAVEATSPAVLGFISYGRSRDEDRPAAAEIYALYVEPARWGSGLGRRLMDTALASLTAQGCPEVSLWVLLDNPRARRFYDVAGFTFDGTTKDVDLFGTTLPEVRYRRALGRKAVPAAR